MTIYIRAYDEQRAEEMPLSFEWTCYWKAGHHIVDTVSMKLGAICSSVSTQADPTKASTTFAVKGNLIRASSMHPSQVRDRSTMTILLLPKSIVYPKQNWEDLGI